MDDQPRAQSATELFAAAAETEQSARLLRAAAHQAAAAEREASRPQQPLILEGPQFSAVVGFRRYQGGREYHYAAIGWRDGRSIRWAVTGQESRRFNWSGLLEFIGAANWHTLHRLHEGDSLFTVAAEPPAAERMGKYGRVLATEDVTTGDTVTPLVTYGPGGGSGGGGGGGTGYASGGAFMSSALDSFAHRFGADEDGFGGHY